MIKISEIPIFILLLFTLVYATIGNPDSEIWSGLYFLTNYIIMLWLFNENKSKKIRVIGISLSISIIIFITIKYFTNYAFERYYTIVPFCICILGLLKLDKK